MTERRIVVQGKGSASAPPDKVVLSFRDNASDKDYETCLEKLNQSVNALRSSIKNVEIDPSNLKTLNFSVSMDYDYTGGKRHFKGYQASHDLRLELPAGKELLNRVLNGIGSSRSDCELNIRFEVNENDALKRQAIENAVADATRNAETIASAANLRLGSICEITYGRIEVQVRTGQFGAMAKAASRSVAQADIEPEDVKADDSVTITWELLDQTD